MKQQILEKPKSYREQLEAMNVKSDLDITNKNRQMFANAITALHRDGDKHFSIIKDLDGITIRVWRLK